MPFRKLAAASAAALTLTLTGAATASAAVYTIGPTDLVSSVHPYGTDDETFVNGTLPLGSMPSIGAPGHVVTWRANLLSTGPIRLAVVHPTGALGEYGVTAIDDQVAGHIGVNEFTPSTPIPIAAGDTIALVQHPGGAVPRWGDDPAATFWVKGGAIAPMTPTTGETFTAPVAPSGFTLFNADVDDAVAPATPATPPTPPVEPGEAPLLVPVVGTTSATGGTTAGGAELVITGASFTAGSRVLFGDVEAPSVTVDRFDRLRVVVPAGRPGTVEVRVANQAGVSQLVGTYTYDDDGPIAAPVATPPAAAPKATGTKVERGKRAKAKRRSERRRAHR